MQYVSTRASAPVRGSAGPAFDSTPLEYAKNAATRRQQSAGGPSAGRDESAGVTLKRALLDGLAPDGGLYVPERIPVWRPEDLGALEWSSLAEIGTRVLAPFVGDEVPPEKLRGIAADALDFPIPLVSVEPGVYALELFHGPTLAFKDVAARVMARLFAALDDSVDPLTILVATSGDTGGAVAHAFARVRGTKVVVLYPDGRVSPTQEAQLTAFNSEGANVRAYAVSGSFDDCQRLVKDAFGDPALRGLARLTSANSINVGRLLPQMIYYFHGIGQLAAQKQRATMEGSAVAARDLTPATVVTPSGNFGNLTAGVMAKRSGLSIAGFVAATNLNDVVPSYLTSGRFEPRPSIATIANAMDVGNPSNFERLVWLYRNGDQDGPGRREHMSPVDAMRRDISGSAFSDREIRETIRRVSTTRGYLLDPHSAIGYLAATRASTSSSDPAGAPTPARMFLATAHPAKFREVVEPIVGRAIDLPAELAAALAKPRCILRLDVSSAALRQIILA